MAVQGELALRQAQVEKLSAVGRRVLATLDPLRSKCSAQLQELLVSPWLRQLWHHPAVYGQALLVSAWLHQIWQRPATSGLEMLPAISSSCFGYWRATCYSAAVVLA